MKKTTNLFYVLFVCLYLPIQGIAQGTWTQKANFPGISRTGAASFVIGHYGFIGCGIQGATHYNDFYKWNQRTNTWSAITSYPGAGLDGCTSFTIEGKGYVGLGSNSGVHNDLWRYDTLTNTWTAMATFPGLSRYGANVFVLGHKAYMIAGSQGGPPYLQDVWVYDAHQNSWTQLNNEPIGLIENVIAFNIGNHGYIGGGWDGSSYHNTTWEYDSTNDTWSSIASPPVGISNGVESFVIGSQAYVCEGGYTGGRLKYGYMYDTNTGVWSTFTNMGANGIERQWGISFAIGGYGYIGVGYDSTNAYINSYWQYYPCADTLLAVGETVSAQVKSLVEVYPNPANTFINVLIEGSKNNHEDVEITDVLGRNLETEKVPEGLNKVLIDVSRFANGIYFFRIVNEKNDVLSVGKFVIEK